MPRRSGERTSVPCSRGMRGWRACPAALFARALSGTLLCPFILIDGNLQCFGVMFNVL